MNEEIKAVNTCIVDKEEDYVSIGLNLRFGDMTDEQRTRKMERIISIFNWNEIPGELRNFVTEWKEKIKDEKYCDGGFIKKAQINFGYGDRLYRIDARTLSVYDSVLEAAAEDILKGLIEIGCNYGEYSGYLD